jgi:hypothetical protein
MISATVIDMMEPDCKGLVVDDDNFANRTTSRDMGLALDKLVEREEKSNKRKVEDNIDDADGNTQKKSRKTK